MMVYAEARAVALLEVIPFYDAIDCDFAAAAIAFMRHGSTCMGDFKVKGLPFPASNFSSIHLILSPLVKAENGRKTLAPVAAFIRMHEITDIRIVGSGMFDRRHQYSKNNGKSWGKMPVQGQPERPPAPTQVIEPVIPASPATDDDLPLWEVQPA